MRAATYLAALAACMATLCQAGPACADPVLSPQAAALIAPVHAALQRVAAKQAMAGPPVSASNTAWREIDAQDASDRAQLVALLPRSGWFTRSRYGEAASNAAWSVVQHQVGDPAFMTAMLARMQGPARRHDVSPRDYALLFDRVAMLEHRPQTYGSQFVCVAQRWTLYSLAAPRQVEARRRSIGLVETEAQLEARVAAYPPCFIPDRKPERPS